MALHFHRVLGKTVVFFTYEMTKEEIQNRHAAALAELDWERLQSGQLKLEEEVRWHDRLDELKDDASFHVIELDSTGDSALIEIQAKIQEYGADIGLLDGLSLALDDLDWSPFGKFCKGLRMLAKRTHVPLIVTHHANRERKKHNRPTNDALDVALGDTLQRYTTLLARLICEETDENNQRVRITLRKVREGRRCTFAINARPAYDFSERAEQQDADLVVTGTDDANSMAEN
jgi:replicative DNA helicase